MTASTFIAVPALALAALIFTVRRRVSSKWIDMRAIPSPVGDLTGRVVVVTGGNVGLGYETSLDLCRRGATVVMGCRDTAGKGAAAVEAIRTATGNDRVECVELDLASQPSVRAFARTVAQKFPDVHALVCNAGVWVPMEKNMKTPDGYEIHFAVNHIGHFLLINCLREHLSRSKAESRIVIVSSGLMKQGVLDMDKRDFIREGRKLPEPERGPDGKTKKTGRGTSFCPTGYADTKLMNALTCRQLARDLTAGRSSPASGGGGTISTFAVCPGWCRTSLGRHANLPWYKMAGAFPFMLMFQRSSVQGAQNIIHAIIEDAGRLQSGGFYRDGSIAEDETRHVESLGDDLPRQLWELSERLVKGD